MIFIASLLVVLGAVLVAAPAQRGGAEELGASPAVTSPAADTQGLSAYLQGTVLDLSGNEQAAAKSYLSALAEDPDNMNLRQRVLDLSLTNGDIATAVRLAKTLPEVEQSTVSRMLLAVDHAHNGKIKDARRDMRLAARSAPGLLQFELLQAYLDFADGAKAEKLVHRLQALPLPTALEGRRRYHEARLWLKEGDYAKALEALELAQAAEPSAIFTTLLLAKVYVHQGMGDKAEVLLKAFDVANPSVGMIMPDVATLEKQKPFASTLDQDMAASMFDFGLMVWAEGALTPARQLINMALWLDPEQTYDRYYLGVLLEMMGDLPAAKAQYSVLKDDPALGDGVALRLAEVNFKLGEKAEGWRAASALARAHPQLAVVHRSLALMAFEREDYARAVEEYDMLLKDPALTKAERVELLFARGAAYERAHMYAKAAGDLQQALELDPANAQIMNYLGYMWVDQGENLEEAFNLLKKAHLLAPDDGAISDSLGWAYHRRGDDATALEYLETAVEQDPESAEISDHLGDAYAARGNHEAARKYWQLALDLLDKGDVPPHEGFRAEVEAKLKR
ncbi:MAG: tetratricopeptide repeat protein [Proteobacteria bacterium]|nr:tetratricopeptide repeat protein [Pseudomonadota bacterium]